MMSPATGWIVELAAIDQITQLTGVAKHATDGLELVKDLLHPTYCPAVDLI